MKKGLALLLAGLICLALAACGLPFAPAAPAGTAETAAPADEESGAPAVTLRFAAPEDELLCDRLDEALARLREELPDIAVERVQLAADGASADLLVLGETEAAARCAAGELADLAAEPAVAALLEKLPPAERTRLTPDGAALAGLPVEAADFYCLFADRSAFEALQLALPGNAEELIACARLFSGAGRALFPADGETAQILFALLLRAHDGRGPEALCSGEASPYDEAWRLAGDELYRLQRAGAFSAADETEGVLILASASRAEQIRELWGGEAALLDFPWAGNGEAALCAAGERPVLAVSAASEHHTLAVDAACRLCELLSGAEAEAADGLTRAVAERRASLGRIEALTPPGRAALDAALTESVRELASGRMTPDEFVEVLAMALER